MASLRGGQLVWGTADVLDKTFTGGAVIQNGVSKYAVIGPGPYVALFIQNTGGSNTATFKVQATTSDDPRSGLNFLDSTDPNGGVTWFDYTKVTPFTVAPGATTCVELAPFSPPLIRLVRTDATGSTTIIALISSFGPN